MSSRRTLILMAAIAVGALAAFAIYSYVNGLEDKANEDARTVAAVRVAVQIGQGTPGVEVNNTTVLADVQIPQSLVTGNEITREELQAGLIDAKVAGATLVPGQILVEGMFVDPLNSRIDNADRIPDGNVAITISVDDIRGVAGLIVPGDFVNMMALSEDICGSAEDSTAEGAPAGASSSSHVPSYGTLSPPAGTPGDDVVTGICTPASMVFQQVQVLFVDRSSIPLPGEVANQTTSADGTAGTTTVVNSGLLTLSVPVNAAQLIASIPPDSWYLTLLPRNYTPGAVPDFDPIMELLPGENPNQLTPYGPEGIQTSEP